MIPQGTSRRMVTRLRGMRSATTGLALFGLGLLAMAAEEKSGEPVTPTAVYTVSLQGAVADDTDSILREALAAAPAHAPVLVDLDLHGGSPASAVKMLERLATRREAGPVSIFVRNAVGPGVLLLAAADHICTTADAAIGPGVSGGTTQADGLPLPLSQLEKLAAPAPRRVELTRAFFENDLALTIGGEALKKPGSLLDLTGAEAARDTGQPPAPLLADAVAPDLTAALKAGYEDQPFQAFAWNGKSFSVKSESVAQTPAPTKPDNSSAPSTTLTPAPSPASAGHARVTVYVVPIKDEISTPQLYILRRALKQAIENHVDAVVLDMDTLGGALNTTLDMMEALSKFPGRTYTYVDDKAISAGSYIAVATNEIYFSPTGRIGAAEVVSGEGADVPETMKRKIDSFMRATVTTYAGSSRYRAEVQRAMMDPAFELKIDGKVLKPPGELLTLTAAQACEKYGTPPEALLGAGTSPDIEAMLTSLYGKDGYVIKDFKLTWSETLAKWLNAISPILLGAGILLLLIEFKTPGFGLMGIGGIALLLLVLASHYVAALSGYEPIVLFALGIVFIALEVLVFTGSMLCGVLGLICFFASFIWAMTDVWPGQSYGGVNAEVLAGPVMNLVLALAIAAGGFLLALRFLPKTWIYSDLMNVSVVPQESLAVASGAATATGAITLPEAGARGVAVTDLRPLGEVDIAGGRYQARAFFGQIARGTAIEVISRKDFSLAVKAVD